VAGEGATGRGEFIALILVDVCRRCKLEAIWQSLQDISQGIPTGSTAPNKLGIKVIQKCHG